MTQSIVEEILKHGRETPDQNAVADGTDCITYGELADEIRGAAGFLMEKGVRPGDKIGIVAEACVGYVVGYFAIHLSGGIAIPLDRNSPLVSVSRMSNDVTFKMLLFPNPVKTQAPTYSFSQLRQYKKKEWGAKMPSENDISDIFFTSGTTGKGKGVVLSHRNIVSGAQNIISGSKKDDKDIELITPPLNHAYGFGTVRALLLVGGMAVLQNGCSSLKLLYENIRQYSCKSVILVPAALKLLYKQLGNDLVKLFGELEYIELGSSILETKYKKKFIELLPHTKLYINYGSTESSRTIYNEISSRPDKMEAIGRPVNHVAVRIVDDNGNIIKSTLTTPGRLVFSGPMNMQGYYNAPDLTMQVLKDGWFYTNDVAYIDEENFIFLLGRVNDVINIGGEKVSAFEIENAMDKLEKVKENACIIAPDKEGILGEIPVVFYTSETDTDEVEIKRHMERELELYKQPKNYVKINELPRNAMGKIDKKKLMEIWRDS